MEPPRGERKMKCEKAGTISRQTSQRALSCCAGALRETNDRLGIRGVQINKLRSPYHTVAVTLTHKTDADDDQDKREDIADQLCALWAFFLDHRVNHYENEHHRDRMENADPAERL